MEEKIKSKLDELSKAKEQAVAHLNAIIGAEQALRELLSETEKE